MGGSLKNNNMVSRDYPWATAAVIYWSHSTAGRTAEARRSHRSPGKDQTSFVCFCQSELSLVGASCSHLPTTCTTRGPREIAPHPSLEPHVSVHTAPILRVHGRRRHYALCSTWRLSRQPFPSYGPRTVRHHKMCVRVTIVCTRNILKKETRDLKSFEKKLCVLHQYQFSVLSNFSQHVVIF